MGDRCSEIIHDHVRGMVICADDGRVIDERTVDLAFEPRGYSYEERLEKDRLGSPMPRALENIHLSTDFNTTYTSDGRKMDTEDRARSARLKKLHMRAMVEDGYKRHMLRAKKVIERIASALKLPKEAQEQALIIYSEAYRAGLLNGRPIECVAAASVYIACRSMGISRGIREIEHLMKDGSKLYTCIKIIYEAVDLKRLGLTSSPL